MAVIEWLGIGVSTMVKVFVTAIVGLMLLSANANAVEHRRGHYGSGVSVGTHGARTHHAKVTAPKATHQYNPPSEPVYRAQHLILY